MRWQPWYALENANTTAAYISACKHAANLAHAVTGMTIKTVWSPALENHRPTPEIQSTYPGETYVDVIAPDKYSPQYPLSLRNWDGSGTNSSSAVQWQSMLINRGHGWD